MHQLLLATLATLLAISQAGLLVDRSALLRQLKAQGVAVEQKFVVDRIAGMSPQELQRQQFILAILQRVQEPMVDKELLRMANELNIDETQYDGGIDSAMQYVVDLDRSGRLLSRNESCRITKIEDVRQLLGIYRFMTRAIDFESFQRVACYFRQRINSLLFVDAFLLALRERSDTQRLMVPAIYEIMPELYYDEKFLEQVRTQSLAMFLMDSSGMMMPTTRRPSLIELIAMNARRRFLGLPIDPFERAQSWMQMRAGMIKDKRDKQVVLPVGRRDVSGSDAALLTQDIGFKAFVQSFIGELTLKQAMAREQRDVESIIDDQHETSFEQRRINTAGERQDPLMRTPVSKSYDREDVEIELLDRELPSVDINSERLLHVSRRRQNLLGSTAFVEQRGFDTAEERQVPENRIPTIASDIEGMEMRHELPSVDVNSKHLLYVGRRRQSSVTPTAAERYRDLVGASKLELFTERPAFDPERLVHVGRRYRQFLAQQHESEQLDQQPMFFKAQEAQQNDFESEYRDPVRNSGSRFDVIADGDEDVSQRRVKYDTSDQMNKARDDERDMERQRMREERDRARRQRERDITRYVADSDSSSRVRYSTADEMNRARDEEREMERQRMREERDRARQQRDREGNVPRYLAERDRRSRFHAEDDDDNVEMMQRRVKYDTTDEMNRASDEDREAERQRMREERDRARQQRDRKENVPRYLADSDRRSRFHAEDDDDNVEMMQRRVKYDTTDEMNRARDEEREMERQRMREERDRARQQRDREEALETGKERLGYETVRDRLAQHMREQRGRNSARYYKDRDDAEFEPEQQVFNYMQRVRFYPGRKFTPVDHEVRRRPVRSLDSQEPDVVALPERRAAELLINNLQQMMARINMESGVVDISEMPNAYYVMQYRQRLERRLRDTLEEEFRRRSTGDSSSVNRIIADILIGRIGDISIIDILSDFVESYVPSVAGKQSLREAGVLFDEPVVQYLFNGMVRIIDEARAQQLGSYRRSELEETDVSLEAVTIDRLRTFIDDFDADLMNAVLERSNATLLAQGRQRTVFARQQRLNHKPFALEYTIAASKPGRIIVRTFLGPKMTAIDGEIPLDEMRRNFILLDASVFDLQVGRNVIKRKSRYNMQTSRDATPYSQLYRQVMVAMQPGSQVIEFNPIDYYRGVAGQSCRFPERLMLPRGRATGLPMQMFTIVSRMDDTSTDMQYLFANDDEAVCGIGMAAYKLDQRSLFYPFDRRIDSVADFLNMPNVKLSDVYIYHDEAKM